MKTTDHFRWIYRILFNLIKGNRRMSTCKPVGLANTSFSTIYAKKVSLITGFKKVGRIICINWTARTLATLIRATSHTRPRVRDHYTSSTLIGGEGRAGPSSHYFTLRLRDHRSEYVNARWMLKSTLIPTWHRMDYGSWSFGLFSKNHMSEVGFTQKWETTALWTLTTIGLF